VLRRNTQKLSASGVDLGGANLFGTRLGFSGTPSELLPPSISPCHFELGSEVGCRTNAAHENGTRSNEALCRTPFSTTESSASDMS